MPFGLFKKPWDKEMCSFVLQEYGAVGGRGWANITEETETPISKLMATEYFQPGKSYRVMARYMEGEHVGQFAGIVWQHHEPARGLALKKAEEEKPKKKEKEEKPKGPTEALEEYADELSEKLEPIVKLQAVLRDMQKIFAPQEPEPAAQPERASDEYSIPPPEYDGKLPIWTHPMVIKSIFGELNAFVDHAANRAESLFGGGSKGKPQPEPEEEEPLLPSIAEFTKSRVTIPKETQEEQEQIEIEEEETTLPMPPVEEVEVEKEVPPLEEKAETVPSLFSDEEKEGDVGIPEKKKAKVKQVKKK